MQKASLLLAVHLLSCSSSQRSPGSSSQAGGANQVGASAGGAASDGVPSILAGSGGSTVLSVGAGGTTTSIAPVDASTPERIPSFMRNDCPGALSANDAAALAGAAHADSAMRWLYPYDATVWPRGLLPPVLQWDAPAGAGSSVRVHLHGKYFDYVGCLQTTGTNQLELPKDVWDSLGVSNDGAVDPISVELTVLSGGGAVGPIVEHWTFANAAMKGAVFYNTYDSTLPAAQNTGAVLRLLPGAEQPEVFLSSRNPGECTGCHSVSANGARLAADTHGLGGVTYVGSNVFAITPSTQPNPPSLQSKLPQTGFGAFTPDGSRFVTNAAPINGGPFVAGNLPGTWGVAPAQLVKPDTGEILSMSGMTATAKMPSFSSDGRHIVFTDHAIGGDGKGLAVLDFDPAADSFSNYRQILSDPMNYPGWAFFLPDGSGVVFTLGTSTMYTSTNLILPTLPTGDLYFVDLARGNAVSPLARLNGFEDDAQMQPYLPAGDRDLHKNYYSTGVPVAAGGYFWVFFTSRRTYGNLKNGVAEVADAKQLWAAALDIGGKGDISHPPFYLRGQELGSGNVRAFAALEPCRADGATCETGIDCCARFCTNHLCGPPPPRKTCSNIDEGCKTATDCCPGAQRIDCIAGFCAAQSIR